LQIIILQWRSIKTHTHTHTHKHSIVRGRKRASFTSNKWHFIYVSHENR